MKWIITRDERGTTAVEYALLVGLIAAAIVLTVAVLGGGTDGQFSTACKPPSPFSC